MEGTLTGMEYLRCNSFLFWAVRRVSFAIVKLLIAKCLLLIHFQVDKAQQRIRQGQRSSMYTADASINAKVKGASGWRELLKLLGFRFQKAANGIPDSVFFPSVASGVADKLAAASNHLHALLGKFSTAYENSKLSIVFKMIST